MTTQTFSLIPFADPNIPAIQIRGQVSRLHGRLNLMYVLSGEIDDIQFPQRLATPTRRDGLWDSTCFELFVAMPDRSAYWEFNVSPSGDWNVYYMDAYRRLGFREETSIHQLPIEIKNEAGGITFSTDVSLHRLISEHQRIQLGIACAIHSLDQKRSYWALAHPRPEPDFHLRESFIIQL